MDEMKVICEENLFDLVDDSIIVEIATWLITSDGSPDRTAVTYLLRFSETCKRMFEIINHPPHCNLIWRFIDIGKIINEMTGFDEGSTDKRRIIVNRTKSQPWMASCVKLSMMWGILNTQNLGLIMSMPNLMDLEVQLHKSKQFTLTSEKKVIATKEREEKLMRMISGIDVLRSIESLKNLTRLYIVVMFGETVEMIPIEIPRTLKELDVYCLDASRLFRETKGPFDSIKSLSLFCRTGMIPAIGACPSITSLKLEVEGSNISTEEMKVVWETCTQLQEISISCLRNCSLALDEFEKSKCCNLIKKLSLNIINVEARTWETMIRRCPNIVELEMLNPWPTAMDIRGLTSLKNLEVLDVNCSRNGEGISKSFSELGGSDGIPFKRIVLRDAKMELSGFFSSHRCHQLREIEFSDCEMSMRSIEALTENVHDSLISLEFTGNDGEIMIPLLTHCSRINQLMINNCKESLMKRIGMESKAPLANVTLGHFWTKFTDEGLIGIAPALKDVIELEINSDGISSDAIIEFVSKLTKLRRIKVPRKYFKSIREALHHKVIVKQI